jgi:putative transposon-encoded protein
VHLVTVATQGDNVNPRNNIETIFSILVTIFGAAGMATIFGKIFD